MEKIFNNIQFKFISIVVAITIWVILNSIMNPFVDGFVTAPVRFENEDYVLNQNKTYIVLDNKMVRVSYIVRAEYQTQIRQSDFNVYVDLKDLEKTNMLQITATPNKDIEDYVSNVSAEPELLHVELDDIARKEFNVKYDIRGEINRGHSIGNVILSPSVVYVSGSNVGIENIESVSIEIPINNNEEMFSGIARVRLLDKDNHHIPINALLLSAEEINYSVVMNTQSNVELKAVTDGTVQEGYTFDGAIVNPKSITINGPRSVVQNMYTLDLPSIDITNFTETSEITYNVSDILPIGITSNVATVKVTVIVNSSNVLNNGRKTSTVIGPHIDATETAGIIETVAPNETNESENGNIADLSE